MIRFISFSGNNSNKWYYTFQALTRENEKKKPDCDFNSYFV